MTKDMEALYRTIPHAGAMCLLDGVEEWDARSILCTASSHLESANPLRLGGRLSAVHGVEYGAQAMAIHGALLLAAAGRARQPLLGFLAAVRDLRYNCPYLDAFGPVLRVRTHRVMASPQAAVYELAISSAGEHRLGARITVAYAPIDS